MAGKVDTRSYYPLLGRYGVLCTESSLGETVFPPPPRMKSRWRLDGIGIVVTGSLSAGEQLIPQ